MRNTLSERLEQGRDTTDPFYGTNITDGLNGRFHIMGPCGERLCIIANTANGVFTEGWEHVSVSTKRRTPNWQEMCFVKNSFWHEDECVVQFHPPRSEYVNNHPYVLHLWRNVNIVFPMPDSSFVGDKTKGYLTPAEVMRMQVTNNS